MAHRILVVDDEPSLVASLSYSLGRAGFQVGVRVVVPPFPYRDLETFLRRELRAAFPDHGLLGEEHADDIAADARFVWVIDPIDGTMNFASGVPLFGISIGLLADGAPAAGCIWVPVGPTLEPGVPRKVQSLRH